ncbi:MAG TPA: DNA (cytosine-5-)-methyltransferase [Bacteroidia bacterium]|jgi:DNA (cytosine-5)-methyltransferase 1|nr:DNA (cytosine-5-)-methyltransferase [Bacteroidia bacterium]
MTKKNEHIQVIELFAGVGGFRLGLQQASDNFKIIWSNQWEPGSKRQDASEIYVKQFGSKGHSNRDIAQVPTSDIPKFDMLVGGFPCQDYSVARTLKQAEGIEGKKGVLWWEIHRILNEKKEKPKYLFLENVDRLLKSPASQRGRDFAIMLASLSDLGYIVEWRVINAAEYGMPQRRRRVFLVGYHKSTAIYKRIVKAKNPTEWLLSDGTIAEAFNVIPKEKKLITLSFEIKGDLPEISSHFNKGKSKASPFENSGIIIDRQVWTIDTAPNYDGPYTKLGDRILLNGAVPKEYYIDEKSVDRWLYLKGAKNEKRINKASGIEYQYNEGSMVFPDPLDKPSRTIITGEGGASPSRFKHVIRTKEGKLRRLTPLELERLNMFPDNHTEGASDIKRAFFMGNALVVGVIEGIGRSLINKV